MGYLVRTGGNDTSRAVIGAGRAENRKRLTATAWGQEQTTTEQVETARVTRSDGDIKVSNTDKLLAEQGFLETCSALDLHNLHG